MSITIIFWALIAAGLAAYFIGLQRARSMRDTGATLHSRPIYYGSYLAILTVLPALLVSVIWAAAEVPVLQQNVSTSLPQAVKDDAGGTRSLIVGRIISIAEGLPSLSEADAEVIKRARLGFTSMSEAQDVLQRSGVAVGSAPEAYQINAAYDFLTERQTSRFYAALAALAIAALGFLFGFSRIRPSLRARNLSERVMLGGLITASLIAILTTVGIVFSVLFETINFFQMVSPSNFFLGTVWDPRFSAAGSNDSAGQFGLLPLLWGTLFISFVALLVAVPVGLLAAIYMAEYASPSVRGWAKPILEILAGIPTIVYGFFALVTVGPFLRDYGAMLGLDIAASSVLTAGLVMGVMIIPFVSSLSDDIITAVPQSLREGSLGLGATKSETIKRVIMPAALPGIVGAVLLAASRAIGETMIVVLAAGIAANLTLNPLEPVTTITVKIVSQLTGDLEFNSPQTLVAFALGLTLFVITLALNVYALYIVRKYREQYD